MIQNYAMCLMFIIKQCKDHSEALEGCSLAIGLVAHR